MQTPLMWRGFYWERGNEKWEGGDWPLGTGAVLEKREAVGGGKKTQRGRDRKKCKGLPASSEKQSERERERKELIS